MISIKKFTFNPFQENTYVLWDESDSCIIIDPGCYESPEREALFGFIDDNGLRPERLINTHCHVDHILGNWAVSDRYKLKPEYHKNETMILRSTTDYGQLFGLNVTPSPEAEHFLDEHQEISFGQSSLSMLFIPGHSPGHLVLVNEAQKFVIGGDVLFLESIGRTDLPMCNHNDLIDGIRTKLFKLTDEFVVYPGHGPETTIGHEKKHNPFV